MAQLITTNGEKLKKLEAANQLTMECLAVLENNLRLVYMDTQQIQVQLKVIAEHLGIDTSPKSDANDNEEKQDGTVSN